MAVGIWSVPLSDFWQMTPSEFWLIHDAKSPKKYGRLREDEAERLLENLEQAEDEWQQRQSAA